MSTAGTTIQQTERQTQQSPVSSRKAEIQGRIDAAQQEMTDQIHHHPLAAIVTMFAAGFGLGLILGSAFRAAQQPKGHWYDRRNVEKLGHRVMDMFHELPDSVRERLRK